MDSGVAGNMKTLRNQFNFNSIEINFNDNYKTYNYCRPIVKNMLPKYRIRCQYIGQPESNVFFYQIGWRK